MPREHESRREILQAIQSLPSVADLAAVRDGRFQHELDLEVVVYGRNYNGRKIGPYVRLLTYEPGETIVREGDWGGNSFYLVVSGQPEVFRSTPDRGEVRISEVPPGRQFGEISVLAGVPHSSTVRASDEEVRLLRSSASRVASPPQTIRIQPESRSNVSASKSEIRLPEN